MIKRTFIQEKLFTYICQHCIGGGGGGGGEGGLHSNCALKNNYSSILNDSLVIFWTVFTSVPTTFDLHCSYAYIYNVQLELFSAVY